MDCTVFPANSSHLQAALNTLTTLLSMSSNMIGVVMYPQFQTQTGASALVKHRHLLDNSLLKGGVSLVHHVQLLYSKPESTARDNRPLSQPCMAVFHQHFNEHAFHKSVAVREGKMGPCPLLKFPDFLGYDGELSKPGASARIEQILGALSGLLLIFLGSMTWRRLTMLILSVLSLITGRVWLAMQPSSNLC